MSQRKCQVHIFTSYIYLKAQLPYSGLYDVLAFMLFHSDSSELKYLSIFLLKELR